jgi:hypothetical protein
MFFLRCSPPVPNNYLSFLIWAVMHVEAVRTFHGSLQLSSPSKCEVEGGNRWTDMFYSFSQWGMCFHSFPDDVEVVSVYVPTHQARHWNILTTTIKEMDTNWVKTGFTTFLPIFNHMVPSKGHHHVPHLHLSPLVGPIYQFSTSSHLIFTLKMPTAMYTDTI